MQEKVLRALLTARLSFNSVLHQEQSITNLSDLAGFMDKLTVKYNHMIKTPKQIKCIPYKPYKVCNVLFHNHEVKFHPNIHPSHPNDNVHLTQLHEKTPRINLYISFGSV